MRTGDRLWTVRRITLVGAVAIAAAPGQARAQGADSAPPERLVVYRVVPSSIDSSVRRFDAPHLVIFDSTVRPDAPLLVFLPGTGGRPENTSEFAAVAARQGYRVIGLAYVDEPAVQQICPRQPDPDCAEKVRRKRIYGDDVTGLIDDRPNESIVSRLTVLLVALDRAHPSDGWSRYLRDGRPDWTRIAVSGLSQGAGMAAYIARAYAALQIPRDHVHVFTLDPARRVSANPFHPSVVGNAATPRLSDGTPAYADEWRAMLGDVRR